MNKQIITLCIIFALLIVGTITLLFYSQKEPRIENFDFSEYEWVIAQSPSDIVLGPIDNATEAKKKALAIWIEIYGEKVNNKKPFIVSFDEQHGIWMVRGSLPPNYLGGVPYILIQKESGKVLAIWHGK